jgi:hypothetical protein
MSVRVARSPKDQANARLLHVLSVGIVEAMHDSRLRGTHSTGAHVEVRDSPVGGVGGKGLFASKEMAAGMEVARMGDPARMRRKAWEIYSAALGLPHDACVQVARSPLVFYDQGWQTMDKVPLWYRQNHAKEGVANVNMSILNPGADPQRQLLVWRTNRAVTRGEELRFTYTDVPWEWDADQRTGMPARGEEGGIESMMDGLLLHAEPVVGLTEPANIAADASDGRPSKRKAPAAIRAHWGLPSDSSDRLSLIALSRLVRSPDIITINQVFENPPGVAVLAALRGAVLRVAVTVGGADLSLADVNVMSLFNLSGSTFVSQRKYDGGLSLPSKLPFSSAKALVKSMLDALAAALVTPDGSTLMTLLLRIPIAPLDEAMRRTIAAVMRTVETDMTSRLESGGGGSGSSSSSSLPMPILPAQPAQPAPVQLDVSVSLSTNARRVVQGRLGRALTQAETDALDAGLADAFSLLTTGDQAQVRATLQLVAFTTLSTPAGAQLWASILEVATTPLDPGGSFSVDNFASALLNAVSTIAGAQFAASSFGP